jgi:hypothetical protein
VEQYLPDKGRVTSEGAFSPAGARLAQLRPFAREDVVAVKEAKGVNKTKVAIGVAIFFGVIIGMGLALAPRGPDGAARVLSPCC